MSTLIDACSAYIEKKGISYLAKEGYCVAYISPTGRKSDYRWQRTTIPEMLRIIKALHLSPKQASELKESDLLAAFQELDRVYEYSTKSTHKTEYGVFNYYEHMETSIADKVAEKIACEFEARGIGGVLIMDLVELFDQITEKLNTTTNFKDSRNLLCKHFEAVGYEVRADANRPVVRGKKSPALMMSGCKPSDVIDQLDIERMDIIYNIVEGLR